MRTKDLVFLSVCTITALYSRGLCLSACLLKFVSLGISLCSDYANFTAKANAFALPRIERCGRQACDFALPVAHAHTVKHTGIQMAYMSSIPVYHIVVGPH